jgi:hypothetical protein
MEVHPSTPTPMFNGVPFKLFKTLVGLLHRLNFLNDLNPPKRIIFS